METGPNPACGASAYTCATGELLSAVKVVATKTTIKVVKGTTVRPRQPPMRTAFGWPARNVTWRCTQRRACVLFRVRTGPLGGTALAPTHVARYVAYVATRRKDQLETDGALRVERDLADKKCAERRADVEEDADETVQLARDRADAVLLQARKRADDRLDEAGRSVAREERSREDDALGAERAAADVQLAGERDARARALADLLRHEREETDRFLGSERERTDAAIATRDDFLGMVAHDLRTLLGGMAMSAAALMTIPCENETRQRVHREAARFQRFTARMTHLVGDLVDVVSIEAGKLQVEPAPHEANELLRETLEVFEPLAAMRRISLRGRVSSGSLLAEFDRERILQVLANLVGNAIKFTQEGGAVSILAEPIGPEVRFTIADNGPGVPAEKVDAIFERYGQSASYDRRGLGLGLYISKCIVEAHGGRIWLEALPGEGSKFFFTLPGHARR
jgi:signal transduction histidine kinase